MKRNLLDEDIKESPPSLSADDGFRSFTEDSESSNYSRVKLFFDPSSSASHFHLKGLVRQHNIECIDNSFRIELNLVRGVRSAADQKELPWLPSRTEALREMGSLLSPKKDKNQLFEEILKTPQKDAKPFVNLLLKKYQSTPQQFLNLSSGNNAKRRNSDTIEYTPSKDQCDENGYNQKNRASLKLNFSTGYYSAEKFSFEPEDGDSELIYQAKFKHQSLMQNDTKTLQLKVIGHEPLQLRKTMTINPHGQNGDCNFPTNDNLRYVSSFVELNKNINAWIDQHFETYEYLKNELRKTYTESGYMESKSKGFGLLKRLLCGSKGQKPNKEFGYFIFLHNLRPASLKSKHQQFLRTVRSMNHTYLDIISDFGSQFKSLFLNAQKSKLSDNFLATGESDNANDPQDCFEDFRSLSIEQKSPITKNGVLSVMVLIEFIRDHHDIFYEIKRMLDEHCVRFSSIYLQVFGKSFSHIKRKVQISYSNQLIFQEFQNYVAISIFVSLNQISGRKVDEKQVDRICALSLERVFQEYPNLSQRYVSANKSSLSRLLSEF